MLYSLNIDLSTKPQEAIHKRGGKGGRDPDPDHAFQRIGDRCGRWREDYLHHCSKELVAEAQRHGCTHIAFENLKQIRDRISDDKKFQQWAFHELRKQTEHKAELAGIVIETVAPFTPVNNARSVAVRSKKP